MNVSPNFDDIEVMIYVILISYLTYGTVVGDWFLKGKATQGFGAHLLCGGIFLMFLWCIGTYVARRHTLFLGFTLLQWNLFTSSCWAAGVLLRIFYL